MPGLRLHGRRADMSWTDNTCMCHAHWRGSTMHAQSGRPATGTFIVGRLVSWREIDASWCLGLIKRARPRTRRVACEVSGARHQMCARCGLFTGLSCFPCWAPWKAGGLVPAAALFALLPFCRAAVLPCCPQRLPGSTLPMRPGVQRPASSLSQVQRLHRRRMP